MEEHAELISQQASFSRKVKVEKKTTVQALLNKLELEGKCFVILVDGKRAEMNTPIEKDSDIMILPAIAGG